MKEAGEYTLEIILKVLEFRQGLRLADKEINDFLEIRKGNLNIPEVFLCLCKEITQLKQAISEASSTSSNFTIF